MWTQEVEQVQFSDFNVTKQLNKKAYRRQGPGEGQNQMLPDEADKTKGSRQVTKVQ